MEKTNLGTVFLLDAGWNDIGSWNSLWDKSPKDKNGNSSIGRVITKNTKNCYLRSESRLIVANGIKDLIVMRQVMYHRFLIKTFRKFDQLLRK